MTHVSVSVTNSELQHGATEFCGLVRTSDSCHIRAIQSFVSVTINLSVPSLSSGCVKCNCHYCIFTKILWTIRALDSNLRSKLCYNSFNLQPWLTERAMEIKQKLATSVTCHQTQVNILRLNFSRTGRYSVYLPLRDGRLSWPRWLVTYRDGLPACRRSPIQVLTRPSVD